MPELMDIFNNDAFSMVTMTTAVNLTPPTVMAPVVCRMVGSFAPVRHTLPNGARVPPTAVRPFRDGRL